MKKNEKLNKWLWKWHFIAGVVSLPFILLISCTGIIYLFKAEYETPRQNHIKEVEVIGKPITLQEQWDIANKFAVNKPHSILISTSPNQATEFVSGRFSDKSSLFIDPYTAKVKGAIINNKTNMFKVRKLHGELLMGKFGTIIIELIASWMVVLILTGLYVWWPTRGWKLKYFFVPSTKSFNRNFYRDIHAITGFWFSVLLLMTLAGGFPWTDVFGDNFKKLQEISNTGYPVEWNGQQFKSEVMGKSLTLDEMVTKVNNLKLTGQVTLHFPKNQKGIFSASNFYPLDLNTQKKVHFDQYSGKQILELNWSDVGILMRGRMWVMAFHQGQFGFWNWMIMLFTAIALLMISVSAIISYLLRKRKNNWGIPKVPASFKVGYRIVAILVVLAIIFPLFGISLLFVVGIEFITKRVNNKIVTIHP